jgi:hypothetical protein
MSNPFGLAFDTTDIKLKENIFFTSGQTFQVKEIEVVEITGLTSFPCNSCSLGPREL